MYKLFLAAVLSLTVTLQAQNSDNNKTKTTVDNNKTNISKDSNKSTKKTERIDKEVEDQMKREEEYAKKQSFEQGDNYDLTQHEVNADALPDVPLLEPDYDFDLDDVYRDDL